MPGSDAGIRDSPVQYLLYPRRRAPSEYEHQEGAPPPEAVLEQEGQEEDVLVDRPWLLVSGSEYQPRYQHFAPPGAVSSRQVGYTNAFPERDLFKGENYQFLGKGYSLCQEVQCEEQSQEPPPHGGPL